LADFDLSTLDLSADVWATRRVVARRPDAPGLFLALAPMDGVTDGSYREVLTAMFGGVSGISMCVSEFVRVTHQVITPAVLLRHCPELGHQLACAPELAGVPELGHQLARAPELARGLARRGHTRAGVPVFVQLLGGEPHWMAEAAKVAAGLGAPGIDLNFGCPAKTVNNSDGGATLLKDPCRVEAVTAAVRKAVDATIPVTAKVRIGWADAEPMVDVAKAAEQGGASWLTVHGRTRKQLYAPPVDWHAIGRARAAVRMPVVANGDLNDVDALQRCAEISGCSAFMIGRGAMARPDLFAAARGWRRAPLERDEMRALLLRYVAQMLADGVSEHAVLGRLKQWLRMGASQREDLSQWFAVIKRLPSLTQAERALV
jgi:tRNA-dihydrouridine synthase C